MSDRISSDLESLWESLLSRQPEQVRTAFASLNAAERSAVLAHLRRMAEEPGWHPEQCKSAAAALDALRG